MHIEVVPCDRTNRKLIGEALSWEVSAAVAIAAQTELEGFLASALGYEDHRGVVGTNARYVDQPFRDGDTVTIFVNHLRGEADQARTAAHAAVKQWLRQHGVSQP